MMDTLILKLKDKIYTTGKISAYLSRESLAINREIIELSKKAEMVKSRNTTESDVSPQIFISDIGELVDAMESLSIRKANFIVEVYGNKFTVDELESELSSEEIDEQIMKITMSIRGVITKN